MRLQNSFTHVDQGCTVVRAYKKVQEMDIKKAVSFDKHCSITTKLSQCSAFGLSDVGRQPRLPIRGQPRSLVNPQLQQCETNYLFGHPVTTLGAVLIRKG